MVQKINDFAILLNESDFKKSKGWVVSFKKCHKLEYYLKHKESASALIETLDDIHKNFQNILADYLPNDIFNIGKTGLYWKIESNYILLIRLGKYI